jgi:hypothetical protein
MFFASYTNIPIIKKSHDLTFFLSKSREYLSLKILDGKIFYIGGNQNFQGENFREKHH